MNDNLQSLTALRRPRLLIVAARCGIGNYDRQRDFKRIVGADVPPSQESSIRRLVQIEAEQEEQRKQRYVTYSPARHVDVLIALMAEARTLLQPAAA